MPRRTPLACARALVGSRGVEALALVTALVLSERSTAGADPATLGTLKTGTVVGVITAVGKPVFAHVFVTDREGGTTTDRRGRFRLDGAPVGPRQVIVMGDAVETQTVRLTVLPSHATSVRIDCPTLDCSYSGKGGFGPGCLRITSNELDRMGQRCSVHRSERLLADTVSVSHGDYLIYPGQREAERDLFPNARVFLGDGEDRTKYAQVAFCPACRRACARWNKGVLSEP